MQHLIWLTFYSRNYGSRTTSREHTASRLRSARLQQRRCSSTVAVPESGSHHTQRLGSLLGHHDLHELLVVDLTVTVNVSLADHLINLLVRQLLAEVGHDVPQLGGRDEAVAVLVEDTEGLLELLLESVSF